MKEPVYYIAGEYQPKSKARIPANDLGFTRAYSAYEALRTYKRTLFHTEDHIQRLKFSLENLLIPYPSDNIENILKELIERNDFDELILRIFVSAGSEENDQNAEVFILADPLPSFPETYHTNGINVITTPMGRMMTSVKSTQYTNAMILLKQAASKEAQDVLYIDENRNILELTRANFFGIRDKTLFTPQANILPGITRKIVLELAHELEMNVEMIPMPYSMLELFDEAFLTSTIKEVMPIKRVDDIEIKVGEKVAAFQEAFARYIERYCESRTAVGASS